MNIIRPYKGFYISNIGNVQVRLAHAYENCKSPPDPACCCGGKKKPKRKKTLWERIFSRRRDSPERKRKRPPRESCRLLAAKYPECETDEIPLYIEKMKCEHENATIRKQGKGYIMEICSNYGNEKEKTKEDELLERIESDKRNEIEDVCNPMPKFTSVGQRWIDLQSRCLHPLYKKYEHSVHMKICLEESEAEKPAVVASAKIPLKFGGCGEKVTFSDFKTPEISESLVKKVKEIKINMKSDLDYKPDKKKPACDKNRENRGQGRIVSLIK